MTVQELRRALEQREERPWQFGRNNSLSSGQTTARNSRRTSGEAKKRSESTVREEIMSSSSWQRKSKD